MADTRQAETTHKCGTCGASPTAGKALSRCGGCKTAEYCSQDCQKKDWPTHRGLCVGYNRTLLHPQLAGYFGTFSEKEDEVYQCIIDTFRLRVDHDFTYADCNHGILGKKQPLPDFEDFLSRAERSAVLPDWWNPEKRRACERRACDVANERSILHDDPLTTTDIEEYYGNVRDQMPKVLVELAERVYGGGNAPGQAPMPKGYRCRCDPDNEDWFYGWTTHIAPDGVQTKRRIKFEGDK